MKQILLIVTLLIVQYSLSIAQWSGDPFVNNAICTAGSGQYTPAVVSDGAGGSIIAWEDSRSGNADIYSQRINAEGVVQWTADGVAICTAADYQSLQVITDDGAGGAIIVWYDYRSGTSYDIFAQRINSSGAVQWTTNGVAVCTDTLGQVSPAVISDGAGGAFITWMDYRNVFSDIYAQHINSSGAVQWTTNGVAICTATFSQSDPVLASDGSGGAIIVWQDPRGGVNADIYAQRINSSGAVLWTANGRTVCVATNNQEHPQIISDDIGGAIITWHDYRSGTADIYAQRIGSNGAQQWTTNGRTICLATANQLYPTIASDENSGAIITWQDTRNGVSNIYAQRIGSNSAQQWTTDGVAICTYSISGQSSPKISGDKVGGAIIAWEDSRHSGDIYAQRINASGAVQWTADGVAISTAANSQYSPTIVGDGAWGAIITWTDLRSGSDYDIYAQKVDRFGNLGNGSASIIAVTDIPNDQGGRVRLQWSNSSADTSIANAQIISYGLWRKIPLSLSAKNEHQAMKIMDDTLSLLYDFVINVPAVQGQQYNVVAPTLDDSATSGTHYSTFLVTAHTNNPNNFYISSLDSGYSVDNLAPSSVTNLIATVQAGPSVNLTWEQPGDPDVHHYEIHRSTTGNFTPAVGTLVSTATSTMLTDNSPNIGEVNYYKVITVDIHGNISGPSSQASAGVTTTVPYAVASKWNLVSVPLTVSNYSKSLLYPTATSNAFAFQNGYSAQATLVNGTGYWLKFGFVQIIGGSLPGLLRTKDSISVQAGWNMIGSISSSVATSGITSNPGGMVTSNFFGYNSGYSISTTIEPGKGYWVKVNQSGKLILASSGTVPAAHRIQIVQTSELPPSPPEFEINNLQSAIPKEFALDQNYPNPFNPTTVIQYAVPSTQYVSLKVYNMLGEVVATLVDGMQDAGYKSVTLDASKLSSGVYTYRLSSGAFSETRKMLLMK